MSEKLDCKMRDNSISLGKFDIAFVLQLKNVGFK